MHQGDTVEVKPHHPQERIAERIVAQIVDAPSFSDSRVYVKNGTEDHAVKIPVPSITRRFREDLRPDRERLCSASRRKEDTESLVFSSRDRIFFQ